MFDRTENLKKNSNTIFSKIQCLDIKAIIHDGIPG